MRRRIAGALVVGGLIAVFAATMPARALLQSSPSLPQELSVRESEAHNSFFDLVWDGMPYIPGGQKVFKAAAPEAKAALVRAIATFVKAYTRTPLFRQRYAEYWEANKPQPSAPPQSMDDLNQAMQESIRQMEENLEKLPPEVRKEAEESIKQAIENQKAMMADKEMQAHMAASAKEQARANEERDREQLKKYEAAHPKNPDALIARRLKEFLDLSATVDFKAALVKRGEMMVFADPQLEAKPDQWKLCYRAGREATDAARAFATEWLKELKP